MKQVLFLFTISFLFFTQSAKAQGQGSINIINQLNCDVYVNAVAICPDDCSEHSGRTMYQAPPTPYPGFSYPITWIPAPPPCSNWQWDYIQIDFICPDGTVYPLRVGNVNSPCNSNSNVDGVLVPPDCADACDFNNSVINASWSVDAFGNIMIIVW